MTLNRVRGFFGIPVSTLMVATLLAVTLIAGSGDAFAQERERAEIGKNRSAVLTGEDYYRGIFLAQGPVASRIPEIRDNLQIDPSKHDPQVIRLINDFNARLTDAISATDPTFMPRFAAAVRSRDHFAIDAAIGEGARATLKAIQAMPEIVSLRHKMEQDPQYANRMFEEIRTATNNKYDEAALRQAINLLAANASLDTMGDPVTNTVVVLVLVAAVALATYIAVAHAVATAFTVALAVAIAVEFAAWTPWNKDPLSAPGLFREQIVDSIARMKP